ncbi:two-component sensor histidine kinase [Thalassotalea eurytherma]|uniref:histidine kinase n=2 Tax=Thalassotalea eurytherma TaxID=1144278 RepID=A0ABQ6H523_9GAMM|nr:two-component sensor histidine kinase [Thalassotalea eurytherma]
MQLTRSIISSSQRTIYIKETFQIINDSEGQLCGILCCYEKVSELEHKFMLDHGLTEYSPQNTNLDYVTSLASSVAHDFNNALAVISGYSQLLLRDSKLLTHKDKFTDYLSRICMATDKISMLTEKLLHFSRDYIPQLERLELSNYIRKKLTNYSSTIDANIHVQLDRNEEFWVMADVNQIDEVLLNLLSNAKDAMNGCTKATPIHINLSLVAIDANKYVCLSIIDSGIGMSQEIKERIFYPLYTTKSHIGAGFGLTNVLNIINQNNGSVFVKSDEELGTEFKIHWPYAH